jgi:sec-independent protein translocase protein TatA
MGVDNYWFNSCCFFGANKIPEIFRGFGKGIREFKEASKEIKKEIEKDSSEDKK